MIFSEEHDFFCKSYINLSPRPFKDARLHIMFPANENKPRFVWVPGCANSTVVVRSRDLIFAPDGGETEWFVGFDYHPGNLGFKYYRGAGGVFPATFARFPESQRNRSLGLLISGQPAKCFKGHLLLFADNCSPKESCVPGDCLPADIPKVLKHFARRERAYGLDIYQTMALMMTEQSLSSSDEESYSSELDEDEDDNELGGEDGSDDAGVEPDHKVFKADEHGG